MNIFSAILAALAAADKSVLATVHFDATGSLIAAASFVAIEEITAVFGALHPPKTAPVVAPVASPVPVV